MDPQSATDAGWAAADFAGCEVYPDGDERPIRTPEEWADAGWDADREPPKTLEEARAALAARIADPDAPDDESVASAYDHLEA